MKKRIWGKVHAIHYYLIALHYTNISYLRPSRGIYPKKVRNNSCPLEFSKGRRTLGVERGEIDLKNPWVSKPDPSKVEQQARGPERDFICITFI